MSDDAADDVTRTVTSLNDPKALRALAHPIRLALVGMLRRHGSLTATQAAEMLGESSGSTSFHLRQLAKYGLVEAAGGGHGRERPWRATTMFTRWPDVAENPDVAEAADLLRAVVADRYVSHIRRWVATQASEPEEWRRAAHFGDNTIWVTPDELAELAAEEDAMLDRFLARQVRPELRPEGARPVAYLQLAIPDAPSGSWRADQ